MQDLPAAYGDPSDSLVAEAEASAFAETSRALSAELDQLRPEDRELLKSRFRDGLSVADIARATRQDARKLYRRFESVLAGLRARLETVRYRQLVFAPGWREPRAEGFAEHNPFKRHRHHDHQTRSPRRAAEDTSVDATTSRSA